MKQKIYNHISDQQKNQILKEIQNAFINYNLKMSSYEADRKLDELITEYQSKHDHSKLYDPNIEFSETDLKDAREKIRTPIFDATKLGWILDSHKSIVWNITLAVKIHKEVAQYNKDYVEKHKSHTDYTKVQDELMKSLIKILNDFFNSLESPIPSLQKRQIIKKICFNRNPKTNKLEEAVTKRTVRRVIDYVRYIGPHQLNSQYPKIDSDIKFPKLAKIPIY